MEHSGESGQQNIGQHIIMRKITNLAYRCIVQLCSGSKGNSAHLQIMEQKEILKNKNQRYCITSSDQNKCGEKSNKFYQVHL